MQVLSSNTNPDNPLRDLVDDEVYEVLAEHQVLSEKGVRDFRIRERFRRFRRHDVPACVAIEQIRLEHPYLQYDTIRKIVYKLHRKS